MMMAVFSISDVDALVLFAVFSGFGVLASA